MRLFGHLQVKGTAEVKGSLNAGSIVYYDNSSQGDSNVASTDATDIPGLTALAYPSGDHAPDGVKQYMIRTVFSGRKITGHGYVTFRGHTGSNGNLNDGVTMATRLHCNANEEMNEVIIFRTTPSSGHKFGISIKAETNGVTIYGGDTVTISCTVECQRIS